MIYFFFWKKSQKLFKVLVMRMVPMVGHLLSIVLLMLAFVALCACMAAWCINSVAPIKSNNRRFIFALELANSRRLCLFAAL